MSTAAEKSIVVLPPRQSVDLESIVSNILMREVPAHWSSYMMNMVGQLGEENIVALIFYGSHKSKSQKQNSVSLGDFYVVIKDGCENQFYQNIAKVKEMRPSGRSTSRFFVWWLKCMSRVLAPTILSLAKLNNDKRIVGGIKLCILTEAQMEQYVSEQAPDNHQLARFSQPMRLIFPTDRTSVAKVSKWICNAHQRSFRMVAPELPDVFTTETYISLYLNLSYRAELRPENSDRVSHILRKEQTDLIACYGQMLLELCGSTHCVNDLEMKTHQFQLSKFGAVATDRFCQERFLRKTTRRELMRWVKNITTFTDWKAYIVDKIERSLGYQIKTGPISEKLWPLTIWYFLGMYAYAKYKNPEKLKK